MVNGYFTGLIKAGVFLTGLSALSPFMWWSTNLQRKTARNDHKLICWLGVFEDICCTAGSFADLFQVSR